ncbi:metabotropic glutamate receptor 2-like isoform X1 [Onthophagus taurus]|uniref:metabotropic glutamate receptor 2-like isoform X1 n=1 Tax=Onthophagus taurus TaxID=166361 RepID=UPI0039BDD492
MSIRSRRISLQLQLVFGLMFILTELIQCEDFHSNITHRINLTESAIEPTHSEIVSGNIIQANTSRILNTTYKINGESSNKNINTFPENKSHAEQILVGRFDVESGEKKNANNVFTPVGTQNGKNGTNRNGQDRLGHRSTKGIKIGVIREGNRKFVSKFEANNSSVNRSVSSENPKSKDTVLSLNPESSFNEILANGLNKSKGDKMLNFKETKNISLVNDTITDYLNNTSQDEQISTDSSNTVSTDSINRPKPLVIKRTNSSPEPTNQSGSDSEMYLSDEEALAEVTTTEGFHLFTGNLINKEEEEITVQEETEIFSTINNDVINISTSTNYPTTVILTTQNVDKKTLLNVTKYLSTTLDFKQFESTTLFDYDSFNISLDFENSNESDGNNTSRIVQEFPWPVKKEAVVEGDIILGGLMMVHERQEEITCGPVMPQGGIQALEAMLFTLDKVNEWNMFPNITIGAHILDDCDKDTYGLEMAVDFIKGSISNIDGAEYHCNKTQVRKVISGVVGAASSVTSIQVANLLRLFKIPQVSFFSTSPELSNKQRFEFFTRTIPSDRYQVKAMVDIVRKMGWSYISIIYEESNYGIKAFEELEDLLAEHNICIAVKEKLVKDSGVADESAYDSIVQKLLTKPRARGAIIFGSDQEVAGVMRAVRRSNATGSFSWIGSDGWSARSLVSDGNEAEVEGTLSVQPQANSVGGFEEYFLNLNVENNRRNPWFVEFWEHHFQCRYPNSSRTPYNQKHTKTCTGKEKLTKQNTVFEDQLQFVSDAVMAFAYAIRDMHKELCHGRPGLCDAMKPTKGTELLKFLRNVTFEGLSGDQFRFDGNGDGPARYNIIHFKQVSSGKYRWVRVGEYIEGTLRLNMSEVQFKLGHPKLPESVCSLPCEQGQAKKYVEGESCCWHCFNCTQYQIRNPTDETQCKPCPRGTVPNPLHTRCMDIPEEYLRPDSGWAIGAMAFSSTGILITMFVAGVFIKHNDTPVVRASGRELSYVLLAGVFMCYSVTFALVLRPNDVLCGIQRFGAGFCFTVVYGALLTKTNRISRIFNAGKRSAKRPSFISPRSQLIICSGLIGIQVLINGVWMVISPARAIHHYPTKDDNLLVCSSSIDASYMIAFMYPIFLIIICTIYAVLTRKIPEAFNESKHIGFAMYTTCVIWLAFVPLYFGTANNVAVRITSMSVTISLSAYVTLACLFGPKLYIILIRPERNVRQSMMPLRYSAISKTTGTTGSGSMMATVMVTAATCNQKQQIQKHVPPVTKEEVRFDEKPKIETKEFGTQTIPSPDTNHTVYSSQDHLQKLNNNCNVGNGPLAIIAKDIQL